MFFLTSLGSLRWGQVMNIDIEDIRAMAARYPNMRVNTLLHRLEKRRKLEELREERERREMASEAMKPQPIYSWFEKMMGRS